MVTVKERRCMFVWWIIVEADVSAGLVEEVERGFPSVGSSEGAPIENSLLLIWFWI